MGLFKALFSGGGMKNATIDRVIQQLGQQGSIMGTAYREISYDDVRKYIDTNDCRVTTPISNPHNGWMEFERTVSGQRYQVTLSRTHDGPGSVLTSKKI